MIDKTPCILATLLAALFVSALPVAAENTPGYECDRLAADPHDFQRTAPPVEDISFLPKQAVVQCRAATATYPGDPRYRFQLGRALLALGKIDESREALQRSADGRYAAANLYLGRIFKSSEYGQRDLKQAFKYHLLAAEQGNLAAQIGVGLMYQSGRGVEIDPRQARNWYQQAAGQGSPHAHFLLAVTYASGDPAEQDITRAVNHFMVAADGGAAGGQYGLGLAYIYGQGVDRNVAKGLELLEASAGQGFELAITKLGEIYMNGKIVERDRDRALDWFCKGGAHGEAKFTNLYNKPIDCGGRR